MAVTTASGPLRIVRLWLHRRLRGGDRGGGGAFCRRQPTEMSPLQHTPQLRPKPPRRTAPPHSAAAVSDSSVSLGGEVEDEDEDAAAGEDCGLSSGAITRSGAPSRILFRRECLAAALES